MISDDSLTLWKEHVYPLKHVIIKLQGTRHSNREDLIGLLHLVLERLKQGSDHGKTEDDDFGYFFSFDSKAWESIFDSSAPIIRDRLGKLIRSPGVFQSSDQCSPKTKFAALGGVYRHGQQSNAFSEFKSRLSILVADEGISFEGVADDPIGDSINLTFGSDQEPIIDRIVRRVRRDLLRHNLIDRGAWREDGFTFEIAKSFVVRPPCWSLSFTFAEQYRFFENVQP